MENDERDEKCKLFKKSGNVHVVGCECEYCKHDSEWDEDLGTDYHYYMCEKHGYYWEGIL